MFLLIVVSITGFILSTILHFLTLFHIYDPPKGLVTFVHLGAACVVYAAIFIPKRICGKANIKDFRKALFDICPKWVSTLTGFVIMYVFVWLIFLLFKKHSGGPVLTDDADTIKGTSQVFSGHLMALYALASSTLYSCNLYAKSSEID